jgi:hypothetical protein
MRAQLNATTILGFAVVLLSAGLLVHAADSPVTDAPNDEIPQWVKNSAVVSAVAGGPVFTIWFAWYWTAKRGPQQEREHAKAMREAEERHAAHVNLLITNFRADQLSMWESKRKDDDRLINAIDRLREGIESNGCKYGGAHHAP